MFAGDCLRSNINREYKFQNQSSGKRVEIGGPKCIAAYLSKCEEWLGVAQASTGSQGL